jgi:hypothetical protein
MRVLNIYPTWHEDYVLIQDDGSPIMTRRSRDLVFGAMDLIRAMYDDVILHRDPR